ncbi:putative peptide chain release factor 2 [Chlamydiales bacterium STE3]|nr:putative peptide chain release factor 2 [Chlamydiales bacterium STE3]
MTTYPPKILLPESDDQLMDLCSVETYRSSGSGGQHVNKTDSAVRLTYRPYNLVVTSQKERSQYLNKMHCLQKLRDLVKKLNYRPKKRIPTKISKGHKAANLEKKGKHSQKKQLRGKIDF